MVKYLDKNENGMIMRDGAVNINLIVVGLASGNASAINPSAGEIAAPAMTVAMEIEIIVGLSILLINITSIQINFFVNTTVVKEILNISCPKNSLETIETYRFPSIFVN